MQTHMDLMDLFRLPPCWCWEPIDTTTIKATATRAKRLMGMTSVKRDTAAVSREFPTTSIHFSKSRDAWSLIDFIGFAVL
jgi:hypothetical protein